MGDLQEIRYKHLILQLIKNKDQGRNVQGELDLNSFLLILLLLLFLLRSI
jgi:hypothetical protein